MEMDPALMLKIGVTLFSLVTLYLFRRKIMNIIDGLLVGGDVTDYEGKTASEVYESINEKLDTILKER